jgi:GWxTD domain-containing protein
MKTLIKIILIIAFSAFAKAEFMVNFDAATFKHSKDSVVWEIYYSFLNDDLTYQEVDGELTAKVFFNINIFSETINFDKKWTFVNVAPTLKQTKGLWLFGVQKIYLKEGDYDVYLKINEVFDSTSHAEKNFKLFTPEYNNFNIQASDIRLAKMGKRKEETTIAWNEMFLRNGYYVIPNPSLEYYDREETAKLYYELYNVKSYQGSGIIAKYEMLDALENVAHAVKDTIIHDDDELYIYKEIPITMLPTGLYYLRSVIKYPYDNPSDSIIRIKKIYFINKDRPVQAPDKYYVEAQSFELSEFAAMSYEQVEFELEVAKIMANDFEKEQIKTITDLKAKKRFLYKFWLSRDIDPKTFENEGLIEVRKAIEHANTFFSYGGTKNGWKTDRGRVLIKYGFPTDFEREVAQQGNRAWSEWWYTNIQGGIRFYFVDLAGYGDFKLVHSTAMGEVFFSDWYNQFVLQNDGFDTNR